MKRSVVHRRDPTISDRDMRRFMKYVDIQGDHWIWKGNLANGYGVFYLELKRQGAHRAAYKLFKGDIPKGMCVCHTCDIPLCCNPEHLFLGTHKENMEDRNLKGRAKGGSFPGEHNPRARFSANDIREIIRLRGLGWKQREIAEGNSRGVWHVASAYIRHLIRQILEESPICSGRPEITMLLSIRHAAERLDVHPGTIRRWARDGLVTLVRLPSGRLRVAEEELERISCPDRRVDAIMEAVYGTR